MRYARFFRHLTISIAILATLMLQLAPAISDMIFAGRDLDPEAICSTTNVNTIGGRFIERVIKRRATRENQAGPDFPRQAPLHAAHCPFCLTHAGSFALPATATLSVPVVNPHFHYPSIIDRSSLRQLAWLSAQPREPPLPL